jgi:hypothetical protein
MTDFCEAERENGGGKYMRIALCLCGRRHFFSHHGLAAVIPSAARNLEHPRLATVIPSVARNLEHPRLAAVIPSEARNLEPYAT